LPWSTFNDGQFTRFCTARCATQRVARVCLRQRILDWFRAVLYRRLLSASKSTMFVPYRIAENYNIFVIVYQFNIEKSKVSKRNVLNSDSRVHRIRESFISLTQWLIYGTIYQFVHILQVSVNLIGH